jgi:hypothetical protein
MLEVFVIRYRTIVEFYVRIVLILKFYVRPAMVGNRHQELACRQTRDLKGSFSSGCTRTPPPGSPSSDSEMWYVAPMLTHQ